MSRDYTREAPRVDTLQDALDQALGAGRLAPGGTLRATSVEQAAAVVAAAHEHGGHVTLGAPGPTDLGLDLADLTRIRELDVTSGLVTVEAGCRPGHLERSLAEAGFTLGHGQFAEPERPLAVALDRGEGQPLVVSTGAILPDGTVFHTPLAPRRATGPDPDALLVGSGGRLSIIAWATLRMTPRPARMTQAARRGPAGLMLEALRSLYRGDRRPHAAWLRVDAERRAIVTVQAADAPIEPLAAALVVPGSEPALPDTALPPVGTPRRLPWSAIAQRIETPGLWLGPTELHGGWVRAPGIQPVADELFARLAGLIDPLGTLRSGERTP